MQLVPRPDFFIVSINKKAQLEKKEKEGSLYVVIDSKNESRNMQSGTIVAKGTNTDLYFPQAQIGHTLLLHWMVESKQKDNKFYEDDINNYYHVTATECNGRPNESYGIVTEDGIIPHPDYILLEKEIDSREMKQVESGLFLFENWQETRTEKEQKMAKINEEIQHLTKTKMNEQLKDGISNKEKELATLSKDINKSKVQFYKVAAINPLFNELIAEGFGEKIKTGEQAGMLNQACQTTLDIDGKEYIIALTKHFWCPYKWCRDAVKNSHS